MSKIDSAGGGNPPPITPDELADFQTKLETWGEKLPPEERERLTALVQRAKEAGPEVVADGLEHASGQAGGAVPDSAFYQSSDVNNSCDWKNSGVWNQFVPEPWKNVGSWLLVGEPTWLRMGS